MTIKNYEKFWEEKSKKFKLIKREMLESLPLKRELNGVKWVFRKEDLSIIYVFKKEQIFWFLEIFAFTIGDGAFEWKEICFNSEIIKEKNYDKILEEVLKKSKDENILIIKARNKIDFEYELNCIVTIEFKNKSQDYFTNKYIQQLIEKENRFGQ